MPDKPPNLIVLFTDQQRWDTVGAYGANPMDLTPNTDAMAARGTLFENAFTCQPVSAPARGSILTGRYATAHTVWKNSIVLPPSEITMAHQFKAHGYETGYIGKWHLAGTRTEPIPADRRGGFDDHWLAADLLEFTSHPYDTVMFDRDNERVQLPGYRVDALTDEAIKFIRQERENPFFLFVSWLEPHHQNDMNRYVAPDGYAARYDNPYVPPDLQGVPGDWYRSLPSYYGIVKRIDECFGRILGTLEESGLDDNTIVLFTTDHGSHFRTRNAEYKRSCHEACCRIPLIAQGPGFDRGLVVPELVSLVDVAPTVLDAAGLPVPDAMQGRSTLPLLDRHTDGWPEEAFIQISEAICGRAIRTERWKYCVYAPEKRGGQDSCSDEYVEYQMYDLFADPHERVNLLGRADYREIADELCARLKRRMVQAGESEPTIHPARYYA